MRLILVSMFLSSFQILSFAESVLVMTSTTMSISCTALASMLGRSEITPLHHIVSESFARQDYIEPNWFSRTYGFYWLLTGCESGIFTRLLWPFAEPMEIVTVTPLHYCWSTSQERPAPFDASCGNLNRGFLVEI